jgi:hypothetical protein
LRFCTNGNIAHVEEFQGVNAKKMKKNKGAPVFVDK